MLRKNIILIACILAATIATNAQNQLTLLGNLPYDGVNTESAEELSDIWGYASAGNEYAIVGLINGTSIVNVTNPANPVEVEFFSGPSTFWRDMKTWGSRAYVTNEAGNGLEIIDLSNLPTSASNSFQTTFSGPAGTISFSTAHNIYIDENGIAYILGADHANGGAIMLDVAANPSNPSYVGLYDGAYVHDAYVRNDLMYAAQINNGNMAIVDVSNKQNPVVLGTQSTSSNFTHNTWLNDAGTHVFTTDETGGAEVGAYDVTDPTNIFRTDGFLSNPGSNVIPHNTHVLNDFLITSHYRDGVTIVDATFPDNLIQVGYYDTSPSFSGNGFNGCWGAYPFLPSGNILASDIENGLYIIDNDYASASFLVGEVTDAASGLPLNNVQINFAGLSAANTVTNNDGDYSTGTVSSGSFQVTYSLSGYNQQTITVNLVNGQVVTNNVQLSAVGQVQVSGVVQDANTGQPIANAQVLIDDGQDSNTFLTNSNGNFSVSVFTNTNYTFLVGTWGYVTQEFTNQQFNGAGNFTVDLVEGYCDDFALNLGWTASSQSATTGFWTLGEPIGTDFNGDQSNPDFDINTDISNQCWVTGNGGGSAGNDDIDGGTVVLTSPVFDLSNFNDPTLEIYTWFYNNGGSTNPDDELTIEILSNGTVALLESITDGTQNSWTLKSYPLENFTTLSNNMQLRITSYDLNGGHIVEAAVDGFCIENGAVAAPVAQFTSDITSGCDLISVNFQDQSTGNPTSWSWTFPGGSPVASTFQNPTVTYNAPGTYNVTLVASTSSASSQPETISGYIQVYESPEPVISNLPSVSNSTSAINLSANPSGGSFSGPGIVFNTFNANVAGPGVHDVDYVYTSPEGCTGQTTETILVFSLSYNFVDYDINTISPKEIIDFIDQSIEIYPNPNIGNFTISADLPAKIPVHVSISNIDGKVVYSNKIEESKFQLMQNISLSNIEKGMYYINFEIEGNVISKPIIVH